MIPIARYRVEDLLEPADELVEDLDRRLRQPPRAALVDPHADQHALALELRARELHELVDQRLRVRAGQQHLEQRREARAHRYRVERAAQDRAEALAKLVSVARAQQPVERRTEITRHAGGVLVFESHPPSRAARSVLARRRSIASRTRKLSRMKRASARPISSLRVGTIAVCGIVGRAAGERARSRRTNPRARRSARPPRTLARRRAKASDRETRSRRAARSASRRAARLRTRACA